MEGDLRTREELLEELRSLGHRISGMEAAMDELRASEETYRGLLDAIDDGVHLNDAEGRFLAVNAELALRLGRSKEEILGRTPFEMYEPARARITLEQYQNVVLTGETMDVERHVPGGRAPYRNLHRTPMRNSAGECIGVVTVSRDITARKLAEQALERERDFTSAVIDTVGSLLVVLDSEGRIVRINRACERITGYSQDEVKGKPVWKVLWPGEENEQGRIAFANALAGQSPNSGENHLVARDGTRRLIAWTNTALFDSSGGVEYIIAAGTDITEQRRAEQALQENNERLIGWVNELEQRNHESLLINRMGDLLQTCLTFDEAYSVVAHSARNLFPGTAGGLFVISASRSLADAVATWGDFPSAERAFAPDECWALRRGRIHVVEDPRSGLVCHHLDHPLPTSYLCVPMMAQGETLGSLHLRIDDESAGSAAAREQLAVNVAEHIGLALANLRLQQTLRDQAIHDLLTGLFNRRYMEEMLERELLRAKRRDGSVGVIMIDIDHFKQFNDLYSHEAGDALLSALGNYLRTHVRGEDVVCRYGGEEITLVLPDSSLEDTRERAEELREGIKTLRVEHRRRPLGPISVSIGVAAFPCHGSSKESILYASDLALYRAKADGRDRVVVAQQPSGVEPR